MGGCGPHPAGETGAPGLLLFAYRRPRTLTPRIRGRAAVLAQQATVLLRGRRHRERLKNGIRAEREEHRLRDEDGLIAEVVGILRAAFRCGHVDVSLPEGRWLANRGGSYPEPFARGEGLFRPFKRVPIVGVIRSWAISPEGPEPAAFTDADRKPMESRGRRIGSP